MDIIRGIPNIRAEHRGNVVTLGNFDGVHKGHQRLLEHLQQHSAEQGVPSLLITFEPQPREFFAGASVPPRLTRLREKVELLRRQGLDRLLLLPFNEHTARLEAGWITDNLLHQLLDARYVMVGDDFRFGHERQGNFEFMQAAGQRHGFAVGQTSTLMSGEERISSSRIRRVLSEGDFTSARALLGHEYFIMGRVVYGRQLGRQLGVPTANIRLQRYKAALEGVYCVTVDGVDGQTYQGIANIGVRPTVDGKEPLLEVHLFDYAGDLYNTLLTVTFKHKLRDERAFDGLAALKAQIETDIQQARQWLSHT